MREIHWKITNRWSPCPLWVDAVEKGHGTAPARNNRFGTNDFLNRCCVIDACLESMLRGKPSKIVFQQYRPISDIRKQSKAA
jgi:hypothetical protein